MKTLQLAAVSLVLYGAFYSYFLCSQVITEFKKFSIYSEVGWDQYSFVLFMFSSFYNGKNIVFQVNFLIFIC